MYCYKCGAEIDNDAVVCVNCGCATKNYNAKAAVNLGEDVSCKSRMVALLLCIFLGGFGAHRFYLGKIGTGILWLFTAGCFGIGWLVDLIMICCGNMSDGDGYRVAIWDNH